VARVRAKVELAWADGIGSLQMRHVAEREEVRPCVACWGRARAMITNDTEEEQAAAPPVAAVPSKPAHEMSPEEVAAMKKSMAAKAAQARRSPLRVQMGGGRMSAEEERELKSLRLASTKMKAELAAALEELTKAKEVRRLLLAAGHRVGSVADLAGKMSPKGAAARRGVFRSGPAEVVGLL
jgi:hypothetical protein